MFSVLLIVRQVLKKKGLIQSWYVLPLLCVAMFSHSESNILVKDKAAFDAAVKQLKPGDTLTMANGQWKDVELVFKGRGTEDKPIQLRVQEKGKVIISGRSNLRLAGEHLEISGLVFKDGYTPSSSVIAFRTSKPRKNEDPKDFIAYNTRLTEIVIDGFNNPERFETDHWLTIYGKNNRVDHSHFSGKGNKGVLLAVRLDTEHSQENYHSIDHNYFGPRAILGANGGETIRVGTSHYSLSDSFTKIENNYFDRCDGELEIISVKSGRNRIAGNTFFESRGTLTLRHGNYNTVENNVFIGNGVDHTGGIRVINKGQTIRNNYLEGLAGYRFGGALVVMNGVPNSAINRYHQVDGARIENNTLINSAAIQLAAGSDQERSAVPINSTFYGNLIYNEGGEDIITTYDDVSGIRFDNNLVHKRVSGKSLNTRKGFNLSKVKLAKNRKSGLLLPKSNTYKKLGVSDSLRVTEKQETGVSWYQKDEKSELFGTGKKIRIAPGVDTLVNALKKANSGDTLVLSNGDYSVSTILLINKAITVKAKKQGKAKITFSRKTLFEVVDGGSLKLSGLHISGVNAPDDLGNSVVRTSRYSMLSNYQVVMENSLIDDLDINKFFNVVNVSKSTMADRIAIKNSHFKNISGAILKLDKEVDDYGIYNAEYVDIENSEFVDVQGALIEFYRGGSDESTFGPHFSLKKSTLKNVGMGKKNKSKSSILLHGVQVALLDSNTFTNSAPVKVNHTVGEPRTKIINNQFSETPKVDIKELYSKKTNTALLKNNQYENGPVQ